MKCVCLLLIVVVFEAAGQNLKVLDCFDRDLVGKEITIVDLEGYMANPVVKLTIVPNANVTLPLSLTVKASGPRFYFNTPSTTGANGPTKAIQINSLDGVTFYLSIFPDRDGDDEDYTFTILEGNSTLNEIPIHILDQDDPNRAIEYPIFHDFTHDAKGFTDDQNVREVITRAANDWAYFLANMNFDEVQIGAETSWIWRDNYSDADPVNNSFAYSGYLLYSHGLVNSNHTSGGQPSSHAFQSSEGVPHSLRRSGTYSIEIIGNYNTLGWNLDWTDDQWYLANNLNGNVADLYSIAHHEMGHAFAFDQGYPAFNGFKTSGFINHPSIVEYMGQQPVNNFNHYASTIDKLSKRGAYGNEYANTVSRGRWLITKFDLLALEAVGYTLRNVSVFEPLTFDSEISLINGTAGVTYSQPTTSVTGGIAAHHWSIASGALPSGLEIDPFNGTINGVPSEHGNFSFVIRVTDQEDKTIESNEVDLSILAPPTPVISSFDPSNAASGTQVTLTGTNFTGATDVSFGGTAASSFTVVSSTSIVATVASGDSGDISVTTPGGTSSLSGFIYDDMVTAINLTNAEESYVEVFPNPISAPTIHIRFDQSWQEKSAVAVITDISGQIIHKCSIICNSEVELSFGNQQPKPGVYTLTLKSGQKNARTKLIVVE